MADLSIHKLEAYYRLPSSEAGYRHRLDSALDRLLDGLLDAELARLNLPEDGLLCLRSIYVPVRLRLSETVFDLAEAWARAFAVAVSEVVRGGSNSNVVWYRTRRELLLDLANGIVAGSREREWAWRQVLEHRDTGSLTELEAVRLWVSALFVDTTAIVPVLARLAEVGKLDPLLPKLAPKQWAGLAEAAMVRIGESQDRNAIPLIGEPIASSAIEHLSVELQRTRSVQRLAARIEERSEILRSARHQRAIEVTIALCRLAVAEIEPALAAGHAEVVQAVVNELLARQAATGTDSLKKSSAARGVHPQPGLTGRSSQAKENADSPSHVPQQRVWTEFGGLLFLLGVMERLGLPSRLAKQMRERGRPMSWFLHTLALKIVPASEDDPAALAFAGLLPDTVPPSANAEPASDAEESLLTSLRAELERELTDRLGDVPNAAGDPLGFVCRRRAEVIAERGWFELRFALSLVSTEIRRAALDLDPGFVPWLGVVVKFVYG